MGEEPVRIELSRRLTFEGEPSAGYRFSRAIAPTRLARAMQRSVFRLRPRSWLRRRIFTASASQALEATVRRDERLLAYYFADEAEIVMPSAGGRLWPGLRERYVGPGGMLELWEGWLEAWDEVEHQLDVLYDLGDGALFLSALHGRGEASGAEVAQPYSSLIAYEDAKAIRCEFFLTWEEGLRAAGVSEPSPPE